MEQLFNQCYVFFAFFWLFFHSTSNSPITAKAGEPIPQIVDETRQLRLTKEMNLFTVDIENYDIRLLSTYLHQSIFYTIFICVNSLKIFLGPLRNQNAYSLHSLHEVTDKN